MIDNKSLILPLLEFPHKDCFYFCQILQRKVDHKGEMLGGSNNNSRLIKGYYITSIDKLEKQWEEMVKLAEVFNARVMINLNPRNFRKAGFHLLQKIANSMSNDDFFNLHKAYNSVCGEYHSEIDKRWLLDVDKEDMDKVEEITKFVEYLQSSITNKPYKILAKIPSKSGVHIISHPFNKKLFEENYPQIALHCNNPTNLLIV